MSTVSYKKNPNYIREVKYSYMMDGVERSGSHICYEKTDDGAVASCYKSIIWSSLDTFRVVEVVDKTA